MRTLAGDSLGASIVSDRKSPEKIKDITTKSIGSGAGGLGVWLGAKLTKNLLNKHPI